jgi:hypothetical protein
MGADLVRLANRLRDVAVLAQTMADAIDRGSLQRLDGRLARLKVDIDSLVAPGKNQPLQEGHTPMSILSEARSLLQQAATSRDLSPAQRQRMHQVAWDIAPCTCGNGSDAPTHRVECLNGLYTPPYTTPEEG